MKHDALCWIIDDVHFSQKYADKVYGLGCSLINLGSIVGWVVQV